ncbi:hypothetical protein ACLMJK_004409 [Lecanora helva]
MKQMSRDPLAAAKARKAERRAEEKSGGITIKPVSLPSADSSNNKASTGFKKGGFKNAFGNVDDEDDGDGIGKGEGGEGREEVKKMAKVEGFEEREVESESEEEWCSYDPRRPTGCGRNCPGRVGVESVG